MTLILTSVLVIALIAYLLRATGREAETPFLLRWLAQGEARCYLLPTGQLVMALIDDMPASTPIPGDRQAGSRARQAREPAR